MARESRLHQCAYHFELLPSSWSCSQGRFAARFLVNKDDAEDVKTVDLSIPVGLSYEYQNIVFDARYNIGVTKIADNVDSNNVIQITVGYKFALIKTS